MARLHQLERLHHARAAQLHQHVGAVEGVGLRGAVGLDAADEVRRACREVLLQPRGEGREACGEGREACGEGRHAHTLGAGERTRANAWSMKRQRGPAAARHVSHAARR
eukprot:4555780-Prymnesium_polylepis.1